MRCVIEGWPNSGGIDPALRLALCGLVERLTADWPEAVHFPQQDQTLRMELTAADWPALARCVVLALRLSAVRGLWLWHIDDEVGVIAENFGVQGLCIWRNQFCTLSGSPAGWQPSSIQRSEELDADIRGKLSGVAGETMRAMGVRGAAVEVVVDTSPALRLFEHVPAEGWMANGQPAAIGRSMIQIDGRKSRSIHEVRGRIEIGNSGATDLDGIRVQVALRGPDGVLLATVEGEAGMLPVGRIRLVTLTGTVVPGRLPVRAIDIGCQVLHQTTADFSARVIER